MARMLTYWKSRRRLFGDEKAFLPLSMEGTLGSDVAIVESGILVILPNDERGRGVLCMDRIRAVPPIAPRDAVLRVLFYLIHVLSEDESLQKKGYVGLMHIKVCLNFPILPLRFIVSTHMISYLLLSSFRVMTFTNTLIGFW